MHSNCLYPKLLWAIPAGNPRSDRDGFLRHLVYRLATNIIHQLNTALRSDQGLDTLIRVRSVDSANLFRHLPIHLESMNFSFLLKTDTSWIWLGAATNTACTGPWGASYVSNLTSNKETGLGAWKQTISCRRQDRLTCQRRSTEPCHRDALTSAVASN